MRVKVVFQFFMTTIIFLLFTIDARANCPEGYFVTQSDASRTYCGTFGKKNCAPFEYACGEKGHQCCKVRTNNPCPSGYEACSPVKNDALHGSAKPLCCKPQPPPVKPKKTPQNKSQPPFKYAVTIKVKCKSSVGTGSDYFTGHSRNSCSEAESVAIKEANRRRCKNLGGSHWKEISRERLRSPSCG